MAPEILDGVRLVLLEAPGIAAIVADHFEDPGVPALLTILVVTDAEVFQAGIRVSWQSRLR